MERAKHTEKAKGADIIMMESKCSVSPSVKFRGEQTEEKQRRQGSEEDTS